MLPIFHPTTTILVDDVTPYLESMREAAPAEMPIRTFSSPEKAIEHIRRQNEIANAAFGKYLKISSDTDRVVVDNAAVQDQIIRLTISKLNKKIELASRFDEIGVIVCDYQMPSMKGTDFFAELGDIPQKRILLTGEADETVAVQAFNAGIIDKFMTKGKHGAVRELFGNVQRFQRDYFRHRYSFVSTVFDFGESLFTNKLFDQLIANLYEEHGFIEHYYLNFPDGALMLDEGQTRKRLVALTDSDFDGILEVLEDSPAGVDPEFVKLIRARAIIPNEAYGMGPVGDFQFWKEMCLPAATFGKGNQKLYYALFDTRDEVDLDQAKYFGDFSIRKS